MTQIFKVQLSFILLIITSLSSNAQAWQEVGPILFPTNSSGQINGIGRVTQIKFHPNQANIIYATSASGGVYKSIDTGHHWQVLGTDNYSVFSCASICIDHSNDQILYLGTGDPNYYGADFSIYKSTDGGATWAAANAGISGLLPIDILMDATDHLSLITATNSGIWQTLNGGSSWINVKVGGAFTDIKRIPNTNILIATTATQVWTSADFGATWVQNTSATFSQASASGMRICVNNATPSAVYVVSNGSNGVVFKSTNSGNTFTNIYSSTAQCLFCYDDNPINIGQGNYNMAACADPNNANHLYVAAHCLWESNDGGISWDRKTAWPNELHTDHHQFEFSPYNNNALWSANDGGIWLRTGVNDSAWQPMSDGVTATEIYKAACSPKVRKLISAGTQDNGEVYYDKNGWFTNRGGDWGSRMMFDYSPENYLYYLEDGERRPFNPQSGGVSYNSPFTPTNNSRIAFCDSNANIAVLGKDTIWYSNNINATLPTWVNVANSVSNMRDIIISSANKNTVYAVQSNKFVKVINLDSNPFATSTALPNSASTRGSIASVRAKDSVVYMSCNAKIFRSSNGGNTWVNITYNLPATNILKIYHDDFSTNETMYICSGNQIFSKTENEILWTNISSNLPKIANVSDFMFYNDSTIASKLRVAYYGRGVWEYAIHASYKPLVDFVANNRVICIGNSINFMNESEADGLTYSWAFVGGNPSNTTLKNPVVSYTNAGSFAVTLIATNANGSTTKTISNYIEVLADKPAVDSLPGNAMQCNGSNGFGNVGKLNVNSNTVTMMCWIKPKGAQNDWSGLIFKRGDGDASGISIKSNNEIRYHWNNNNYGFSSNLYAVDNQWNHCALVIQPNKTTIYVNGIASVHNTTNAPTLFNNDLMIGIDQNGGNRKFTGLIDEVVVYNKALTQNQIREQMHLTKNTNNIADSLIGYWQMNRVSTNNTILNKANCNNQMTFGPSVYFIKSTAPLGAGNSQLVNATASGILAVPNADVTFTLPATGPYCNGEICVSHIFNSPDEMPNNSKPSNDYFIVDNYGSNKIVAPIVGLDFMNCGQIAGIANEYVLYNRAANEDGNTWSNQLSIATNIVTGYNGNISFNPAQNVINMGQFVVEGPYFALGINTPNHHQLFTVSPNPSSDMFKFQQQTSSLMQLQIFSTDGKLVHQQNSTNMVTIVSCESWKTGIYFYSVISNGKVYHGKLEIVK